MSFAKLKKQSRSGSLTDKLIKQVEKLNDKGSNVDERIWKPVVDKSGNGYAVIVFCLHQKVKICLGQNFGITHFKGQLVSGTLKTH